MGRMPLADLALLVKKVSPLTTKRMAGVEQGEWISGPFFMSVLMV